MIDFNDRAWRRIRRYIAGNQAVPARAALEALLAREPRDTAAHLILGGLLAAEDHQRAARTHALAAADNPPDDPGLLGDLVAALLNVGEVVTARRMLDRPAVAGSAAAPVLMRAASQRQMIGEHALALRLIERARDAGASGRDFHFAYAVQLAFNARLDQATAELERCVAIDPPLGRAYSQLARMHRQTAASNHLSSIDAAITRVDPASEDCAGLEFARYKELEDLGRYHDAWRALSRANAVMYARRPYAAAREAAVLDRLIESTRAIPVPPAPTPGDVPPVPIFIVGMPRSGTTVLDRILGAHSGVESAGELGDFARCLALATDHRIPGTLDDVTVQRLAGVDWGEVGRRYVEQTAWRAHGKRFFVDKMPSNWTLAGLIHRALPRARILHLVRDPMDVCFSNWRAYFGPGPEFDHAYDLAALAAHYLQYRRLMAHWRRMLPGAILDVDYAGLVHDPEAAARRILDFCGLSWEPGCVDLTRNAAPVATLSVAQVRQPVHARAFGEWRPYAEHLDTLRRTLAAAA